MMLMTGWSMLGVGSREARAQSLDGCPEAIVETFQATASRACATAWCETHWDNAAIGRAGEVSMFQIHPVHFGRYDRQRLRDDEWYAAQVAFEMSAGGRDWRAWTCR